MCLGGGGNDTYDDSYIYIKKYCGDGTKIHAIDECVNL